MASENLAKLQATVNRYASRSGFTPLVIDGGMGLKTEQAILRALSVGDISGDAHGEIGFFTRESIAGMLDSMLKMTSAARQTFIMQNLPKLTSDLTTAADDLKLPPAASVQLVKPTVAISPNTTPDRNAFNVTPPASMGSFDKARLWLRQQPLTTQAGIGIGSGILLLLALTKLKGAKKSAGKGR